MAACRLCLSKDCTKLIIVTKNNELPLRIKHCVSVEINDSDVLPRTVCTICIQKVDDWYQFKDMCTKSQGLLKKENLDIKWENDNEGETSTEWSNLDTNKMASKMDLKDVEECNEKGYYNEYTLDKYKCEICSNEFDTCLEYLDHQDEHTGQAVFKCDKCAEVFTNRLDLVEHEKKHKSACPSCGKLILKQSLKLHLIQHTNKHVCTHCSHKFSSRATLQQHIITVHTDIRDHICESCGKRFSSKTAMNVHLKTHTEERRYSCKLCSYAGRTSSAIYIHMATHANEIHSCEMCPKTFKSSRNLSDHLRRVHSKVKKHQCSYCSKKFVDKYMLIVHVRTHTGVRPYKCELCDKAFIRSDSLKEHMAIHGSRRFYECNQCMKKFTSKRGYIRHSCNISSQFK